MQVLILRIIYTEHTHFRDGRSVMASMVRFNCPAKKIVYTSKDPSTPKVVVIFESHHSHPPWPEEKPNQEAKEDLKRCLEAFGILGATAHQVDNGLLPIFTSPRPYTDVVVSDHSAASTIAILGTTLSAKHDAFRNKKLLHEKIKEKKNEKAPAGCDWQGMLSTTKLRERR
jgi:hypothetical protein